MIVGFVAALAHGRSRATQDVDLVVDADEAALRRLVTALPEARFYVDLDAALDARHRGTLFNVIDPETGSKLDRASVDVAIAELGLEEQWARMLAS